ncbi:rRNA-processing protein las1 [Dipsacomyces acuminosporus]|nr:rRNA-processing protein las1 [Dipsacomyces acuminosporus]
MALSRIPKVVSWTSTEEYMAVAGYLYSQDISDRRKGIATVKSWRARGRVPVAIDATANLVEIIVADQGQGSRGTSVNQLRHMYTMALIRFVNSIVDLEQKGLYAQSIAGIANRIGMPAWFVELRHAGTHEQIPSLAVLRSACSQALYWLRDYYWDRQTRTLPEDTLQKVRDALMQYASDRAKVAAGAIAAAEVSGTKKGKMPAEVAAETAINSLSELIDKLHSDAVRLYVVPALLEVGLLVPEDKRLRSKFPDCNMPPALLELWMPAFQLFQETWGTCFFFEELVAGIIGVLSPIAHERGIFETGENSLSTSQSATLVAWIRWTLENYYNPNDTSSAQFVNIDDLLEGCLRSPSYYSRSVLKIVSSIDPALKKDLKPFIDYMGKALAALVAIESGETSKPKHQHQQIPTLISEKALQQEEDVMRQRLERFFKPHGQAQQEGGSPRRALAAGTTSARPQDSSSPKTSGRWRHVPEAVWLPCPIGTINSGEIPSLELPAWLDQIDLETAQGAEFQ